MGVSSTTFNLSFIARGAMGVSKSMPRPGDDGMSKRPVVGTGRYWLVRRGCCWARANGGGGGGAAFLAMMGEEGRMFWSGPGPGVSWIGRKLVVAGVDAVGRTGVAWTLSAGGRPG
jgi:hypothetical protein